MENYYYIHEGKVHIFLTQLERSREVSSDYDKQQSVYVSMNQEQITFFEANKEASKLPSTDPNYQRLATVQEVWNCELYVAPDLTNDQIRSLRQEQYKLRSDSFYMAYQKYLALGETEKAEASRLQWLAEIEAIEMEYPYNIE